MAWIRQKTEPESGSTPGPSQEAPQAAAKTAPTRETKKMVDTIVNIGQSVQIKGELKGNEELTIVMVTHDDNIAAQADRIIKLKDGLVVQS